MLWLPIFLSAQLTLSIPQLTLLSQSGQVTVPLLLENEWDEVGGLQVDVRLPTDVLQLETIRTTRRTEGWIVQQSPLKIGGDVRLLLYDPGGNNIVPGNGPIVELVFTVREGARQLSFAPLDLVNLTISSPTGDLLPSRTSNGSVTIGTVLTIGVGTGAANQGEPVALGLFLNNRSTITDVQCNIVWNQELLELEGVTPTPRTSGMEITYGPNARGIRLWLRAKEGAALEPGEGEVALLNLVAAEGLAAGRVPVFVEDVQVNESSGQMRTVASIENGSVTIFPGFLEAPRGLMALSGQEKQVALSWIQPAAGSGETPRLAGYTIYRSTEAPALQDTGDYLISVPPNVQGLLDTAVVNGEIYYYAVAANYEGLYESDLAAAVEATPLNRMTLRIGNSRAIAGEVAAIPISLRNNEPVAGVRFKLNLAPAGYLANPVAILGKRAPPDWVIALEEDTTAGNLAVVALSPRLTTLLPGDGTIMTLSFGIDDGVPPELRLEAEEVVVSSVEGRAYQTQVHHGSLSVDIPFARLRLGTGAPALPGDTGYVAIFMDNPQPVQAFQMIVQAAGDPLRVLNVAASDRLPGDFNIDYRGKGVGAVGIIGSSFSNTPIPPGIGPILTLAYSVSPEAQEGFVDLDLVDAVLSNVEGRSLKLTTVSGAFPVGEVKAVFTPEILDTEPGRTATVSVGLVSSVDLCGFEMVIQYDSNHVVFLSAEGEQRLEQWGALNWDPIDQGSTRLRFINTERPIQAGSGRLFNLAFALDDDTPQDTSLSIGLTEVSVKGCRDDIVFAMGQESVIYVGQPTPRPVHFALDIQPTGVSHYIRAKATTLGGVYLRPGDEVAVIDSTGWIGADGSLGPMLVGAGVVQEDGSVEITASLGFDPGEGGAVFPGARPGSDIIFMAWDKRTGFEGRPSKDARYVLGEGVWGENNGLTLIGLIRIPQQKNPKPTTIPAELEILPNIPNPFTDSTLIRFGIPAEMEVKVAIYDLLGREIVILHDGLTIAGYHDVAWDGKDAVGRSVKSGMVFYQIRTPMKTVTEKMLLMR